ncbi:cytochrome c biogenesis protein ResB [Pelovirga terrestris]|uniref:Cytochrome c biogenesis protein ResB n=1 Tax=Pelovirga terrestris TaxID=2771352 RepID=A0A8J6URC8_9BACT|nr:cytochrome c biogenesis protein ResB [Pelovirga terrestris]MBD1401086.1 cytochrome c biogenesis protein ResB [Pelovirga terrestris]
MPNTLKRLWRFFASVPFALLILLVLAVTSIIGTLIKQDQEPNYYLETFGETIAGLLDTLQFTSMYSSWWYLLLLMIFALNLLICSIDRFPTTWRLITAPPAPPDTRQRNTAGPERTITSPLTAIHCTEQLQETLMRHRWRDLVEQQSAEGQLITGQRGKWSRLSVYGVHLSILIILAGAVIGGVTGFKAYVFLPEGRSTEAIFLQGNRQPIALGFTLACDQAQVKRYADGSVSEYRADLRIVDARNSTSYEQSVIVNHPLSYDGINFYLAEFYPLDEYYVVISNLQTGAQQAFRAPPHEVFSWPETQVNIELAEFTRNPEGYVQLARIRFAAGENTPAEDFWVRNHQSITFAGNNQEYQVSVSQLSSVLLLANKDPGVMIVYSGFILMLIGLPWCFLTSHQRIRITITKQKTGCRIGVDGSSNKHHQRLENQLDDLTSELRATAQRGE